MQIRQIERTSALDLPGDRSASSTATSSGRPTAKQAVAIALRNRWRRMQLPAEARREVVPNNIILIGPTGVGKTEIARRLSQLADLPFLKVEATKFTEKGYVGRDVDSMVRDLVESAASRWCAAGREGSSRTRSTPRVEEQLIDIAVPAAGRRCGRSRAPGALGAQPREDPRAAARRACWRTAR